VRFTTESSARRAELARQEFDQFVTGSTDGLLRTAYLVAGDLSEAEDLVQECLLSVAKRWPRVRRMDHPLAYARRVLVNLALDGARRRSRRQLELSDAAASEALPDEAAGRELGSIDTRSELMQALAALPPRQRAVLVLRYFEDLSEAQVATALGCSIGTVKSAASRGLARLAPALEHDRPHPPGRHPLRHDTNQPVPRRDTDQPVPRPVPRPKEQTS
jgi:RNA polymerase sigma-70 factor (sigma-E family)